MSKKKEEPVFVIPPEKDDPTFKKDKEVYKELLQKLVDEKKRESSKGK